MELQPNWKIRWFSIAVLTLPTLALIAYSLRYPAVHAKGKEGIFAYLEDKPAAPAPSGLTWAMQESGTTASLRGIDSVDGKVAWASGTEGTVLKTVDGGEHWTRCAVPDGATDGATLDFRGVQAWDATTAIAMASGPGEKSRLYKTTDGCKTWQLTDKNEDKNGFWDAIRLWTPTDGFLAGDPIEGHPFLAEFRGKIEVSSDSILYSVNAKKEGEGAFAASNSSITFGPFHSVEGEAREVWFATGGIGGSRVIHFQHFNGGEPERESVTVVDVPVFPRSESGGIFSIALRSKRYLIAVGGDYAKPKESIGTAAWTVDSGLNWTASIKPPHGYRSSVAWSEELKAWIAAGTNGSDISRDDGKTWAPLDDGNWNALSLPFVVGPKGRVARLSVSAGK
jgi:photosystem II stability/assembly factor-like uncharacterized protein